jgi:hypothetical protein
MNTLCVATKDYPEEEIKMIQFIIGMFAVIGLIVVAYVVYLWFSTPAQETEAYTEEEKFLADLLIMKNDLDADMFATKKEIIEELEKHTPTDNYFDGDIM